MRSLIVLDGDGDILTASERGYGKRTPVADYPRKGRGTQGVIALQTSARNGKLVGAIQLTDHHEVLLISDGGTLVRTRASEISQVGRNTQGVTLMRLADGRERCRRSSAWMRRWTRTADAADAGDDRWSTLSAEYVAG